MKIHLSLELTDTDRRTVRAAIGRGGVATRKEVRIFAERAIRGAIAAAPDPKPKRAARPAPPPPSPIALLPPDTPCARCGRPKDDHGLMSLTCPPRTGRAHGGRFRPAGVS